MNVSRKVLADDAARAAAMGALERSLLVEAGAGSGKTAVMAGRVALLIADGVAPKAIAAVTFTELAAGELLSRVSAFIDALRAGRVPAELAIALPGGLSALQLHNLKRAAPVIDQLTCSTIHGFCQRLILPYPVEADIDPGAVIMDRQQADQVFGEMVDTWLWAELDGAGGNLVVELAAQDAAATVALARKILGQMRERRGLTSAPPQPLLPLIDEFCRAAAALAQFVRTAPVGEGKTLARAIGFEETAARLGQIGALAEPARLARLLTCEPHADLCTKSGFKTFGTKGAWEKAATQAGLPKADGARLFQQADELQAACCDAWTEMKQQVAAAVLAQLIAAAQPVLERFSRYKRNGARLDFDDLIHSARALLRDHDTVRRALGARYAHVLVDEFQDTDPLQSEIFWRLCGDPAPGGDAADWTAFQIRPGALFLVGDPKQAIYRFRGADIAAYQAARSAFARHDAVLSIATNFRSCAPILDFVNQRFEACLNAEGQPGFTALDAFHAGQADQLCVAALEVAVAGADGAASSEQQRDGEAEAVADMCQRLIGNMPLVERHTGALRTCRPGDIALLAPTGSELWRYEEALERRGIPVVTQAGKGFYRRQEVQDLIAITRVLADRRDTLALAALLRGPMVGLTEEELLDLVWALPRAEGEGVLPRLDVDVDLGLVHHALARDVLAILQQLRRLAWSTTPHLLLSQAVDMLRVRPVLQQRHQGQAERALANVDKYLSMSQAWAAQGLDAFAAAMTAAWSDESRAAEGQPDAQEDAVTLYTMHAAKGLEWPVVVPINTMTRIKAADSAFCERIGNRLCCPVFGTTPPGYDAARALEAGELERERIRLWYVAATRARDLLVLPRLDVAPASAAWLALLDLRLAELPSLTLPELASRSRSEAIPANMQTRAIFEREAGAIMAARRRIDWLAPSRDEGEGVATVLVETGGLRLAGADDELVAKDWRQVQGGRERGLVMHKLFEEVLSGETDDDAAALQARAAELIESLGCPCVSDPATGLSPLEISHRVRSTLELPEIAALRPRLVPEYAVWDAQLAPDGEQVTTGVADALCLGPGGVPQIVIDWKSDVEPGEAALTHYQAQVSSYLAMTGAERGLIVLATLGRVITVVRQ
jgi:ATP-dependent exoDNAse (exonuclease V) beta subunit